MPAGGFDVCPKTPARPPFFQPTAAAWAGSTLVAAASLHSARIVLQHPEAIPAEVASQASGGILQKFAAVESGWYQPARGRAYQSSLPDGCTGP